MNLGERATGDLFLKLETARQGPVKGESQDSKHAGEIDLIGWRWGMDAKTAMGGAGSIDRWARLGFAQADRVHLTRAGYGMVAEALYAQLMRGYLQSLVGRARLESGEEVRR